MSKIQKINNNVHIGSDRDAPPYFIGVVKSINTGDTYITKEEDLFIRPGFGNPMQGGAIDYVMGDDGYAYGVRGNELLRYNTGTGLSDNVVVANTSSLETVAIHSGVGFVDTAEPVILVVDVLVEGCSVQYRTVSSIQWGEVQDFEDINISFGDLKMGHYSTQGEEAELPWGDNPLGPNSVYNWRGEADSYDMSNDHFLLDHSDANDGFIVTDIKECNNNIIFQITNTGSSGNQFHLNDCVIFTVKENIGAPNNAWNQDNIIPVFAPIEFFASAKPVQKGNLTQSSIGMTKTVAELNKPYIAMQGIVSNFSTTETLSWNDLAQYSAATDVGVGFTGCNSTNPRYATLHTDSSTGAPLPFEAYSLPTRAVATFGGIDVHQDGTDCEEAEGGSD